MHLEMSCNVDIDKIWPQCPSFTQKDEHQGKTSRKAKPTRGPVVLSSAYCRAWNMTSTVQCSTTRDP